MKDTLNLLALTLLATLAEPRQNWQVFAGPFKAKEAVHAQAIRLGYKVSKEISQ
jgi:hypothetical protein